MDDLGLWWLRRWIPRDDLDPLCSAILLTVANWDPLKDSRGAVKHADIILDMFWRYQYAFLVLSSMTASCNIPVFSKALHLHEPTCVDLTSVTIISISNGKLPEMAHRGCQNNPDSASKLQWKDGGTMTFHFSTSLRWWYFTQLLPFRGWKESFTVDPSPILGLCLLFDLGLQEWTRSVVVIVRWLILQASSINLNH